MPQSPRQPKNRPTPVPRMMPWWVQAGLPVVFAALLVAITVALFGRTLDYPFISYDLDKHIVNDPNVKDLSVEGIARMFSAPGVAGSYYPMRVLSFAIDWSIWRDNPRGYHLSNLLIHIANVLLVFSLGVRLVRRLFDSDDRPLGLIRPVLGGFVAALLFTVHPLVVEPVTWQGAREELLMMLFTLLCIHVHHSARMRHPSAHEGSSGARTPLKTRWPIIVGLHLLAGLFALAAGLSSALGAAVPLVVLAYEISIPPTRRWRQAILSSLHLWFISIAVILVKLTTHQEVLESFAPSVEPAQRPLLILQTYARNLAHYVWPAELILIYPKDVPDSLLNLQVLLGAGLVAATLGAAWLLRHYRLALFGLCWMIAGMAPSSQAMPNQHFQADRFLYLPLAGVCLLVAAVVCYTAKNRRLLIATLTGCTVAAGALGIKTDRQLLVWKDDFSLYGHGVQVFEYHEYYQNRGLAYVLIGKRDKALADFNRSIELAPQRWDLRVNRANVLFQFERYDEAIADLSLAIEHDPDLAQAYAKRAHCYVTIGRYKDAREDCRKVLELDPESSSGENARRILAWMNERGLGF